MRVFLGAPLTQMLTKAAYGVREDFHNWLMAIIAALEAAGYEVISPHRRENWGEAVQAPEIALLHDTGGVKQCDTYVGIIAYPGEAFSPGVQMELGMAHLLNKPIILVAPERMELPYLNQALVRRQGGQNLVRFSAARRSEVAGRLVRLLNQSRCSNVASAERATAAAH